ncbi:hypothetical protein SUDANB176_03754 [Streptomyces sp. enrichment culture]
MTPARPAEARATRPLRHPAPTGWPASPRRNPWHPYGI